MCRFIQFEANYFDFEAAVFSLSIARQSIMIMRINSIVNNHVGYELAIGSLIWKIVQ